MFSKQLTLLQNETLINLKGVHSLVFGYMLMSVSHFHSLASEVCLLFHAQLWDHFESGGSWNTTVLGTMAPVVHITSILKVANIYCWNNAAMYSFESQESELCSFHSNRHCVVFHSN